MSVNGQSIVVFWDFFGLPIGLSLFLVKKRPIEQIHGYP